MALENMRIIRLEAENVKRIEAVEITPSGDLIEISGKNGNGKTSVLDSILWALAGGRAIQFKPIREGAEAAKIVVDLGDENGKLVLRVVRTFKAREDGDFSTTLTVTNAEGFKPSGAQTLLGAIVGALSFDPSEFVHAKPDEQIAILKNLVSSIDPDADFDGIAKRRKAAYEARTEVNRDAARAKAAAAGIVIPEDAPEERVDEDAITARLQEVGSAISAYHTEKARRDRMKDKIAQLDALFEDNAREVARLREEADALARESEEFQKEADGFRRQYAELPPIGEAPNSDSLAEELRAAQAANRLFARREERARLEAAASAAEIEANAYTVTIGECDEATRQLIASADLPISGLGLTESYVELRGVPFDQASDAEKLRASMALAIAANPRLRVIRIREGGLFDDDALETIREVAQAEGFQIWMECVRASGIGETIVIENGRVKS